MHSRRWVPAYVALGSNLDDPRAQVERALAALDALPDTRSVLHSSLYRTRPFGPVEQPDFVNAVAGLLTLLDATALLDHLKALEAQLGRERPPAPASHPDPPSRLIASMVQPSSLS